MSRDSFATLATDRIVRHPARFAAALRVVGRRMAAEVGLVGPAESTSYPAAPTALDGDGGHGVDHSDVGYDAHGAMLRDLTRVACASLDDAGYSALVGRTARRLARHKIADGVRQVREHVAAGDRVLIVTASEERLVVACLRALGVSGVEVVASRIALPAGRMDPHLRGPAKVAALRALDLRSWDVAYSDSLSDLPLLAGAADAVLVNATRREAKRARTRLARLRVVRWR